MLCVHLEVKKKPVLQKRQTSMAKRRPNQFRIWNNARPSSNVLLTVSESGDAVVATLCWPARRGGASGTCLALWCWDSTAGSPVKSCRCGHHHWIKGGE